MCSLNYLFMLTISFNSVQPMMIKFVKINSCLFPLFLVKACVGG